MSNSDSTLATSRTDIQRTQRKSRSIEAHCHPFLFALMTLCSIAELGLTAFLVSAGNAFNTWYSPQYHSLLLFFVFNSSWTLLFSSVYLLWIVDGAAHFLANVASSVIWLLVTSVLWGTAAGMMHHTRTGGSCPGRPPIHRCRQSLTVEALGWTTFGLCLVTLIVTCLWVMSSRLERAYRSSSYYNV